MLIKTVQESAQRPAGAGRTTVSDGTIESRHQKPSTAFESRLMTDDAWHGEVQRRIQVDGWLAIFQQRVYKLRAKEHMASAVSARMPHGCRNHRILYIV